MDHSSSSQSQRTRSLAFPFASLAVLTLLLAGCSSPTTATTQTPAVPTKSDSSASSSPMASIGKKYANGTYSATGNYDSPSGTESVDVSLTLKDGVITNATFQGNAQGGRSQRYQQMFADGFKEQVVGKSLADLSLTVVNGSSLTPLGFMDAAQKIAAQAQI